MNGQDATNPRHVEAAHDAEWPVRSKPRQHVRISVQPPLADRPRVPVDLMSDRARWSAIMGAVAGADTWRIAGSRGVVNDLYFLSPDEVAERRRLAAGHPHHVGPCVPGPILTDVER